MKHMRPQFMSHTIIHVKGWSDSNIILDTTCTIPNQNEHRKIIGL